MRLIEIQKNLPAESEDLRPKPSEIHALLNGIEVGLKLGRTPGDYEPFHQLDFASMSVEEVCNQLYRISSKQDYEEAFYYFFFQGNKSILPLKEVISDNKELVHGSWRSTFFVSDCAEEILRRCLADQTENSWTDEKKDPIPLDKLLDGRRYYSGIDLLRELDFSNKVHWKIGRCLLDTYTDIASSWIFQSRKSSAGLFSPYAIKTVSDADRSLLLSYSIGFFSQPGATDSPGFHNKSLMMRKSLLLTGLKLADLGGENSLKEFLKSIGSKKGDDRELIDIFLRYDFITFENPRPLRTFLETLLTRALKNRLSADSLYGPPISSLITVYTNFEKTNPDSSRLHKRGDTPLYNLLTSEGSVLDLGVISEEDFVSATIYLLDIVERGSSDETTFSRLFYDGLMREDPFKEKAYLSRSGESCELRPFKINIQMPALGPRIAAAGKSFEYRHCDLLAMGLAPLLERPFEIYWPTEMKENALRLLRADLNPAK